MKKIATFVLGVLTLGMIQCSSLGGKGLDSVMDKAKGNLEGQAKKALEDQKGNAKKLAH